MTLPLGILLLFRHRGLRFLKLAGFALVPSMALLLVTDLMLRLGGFAKQDIVLIEDQRLGHRLEPDRGEADGWVFRMSDELEGMSLRELQKGVTGVPPVTPIRANIRRMTPFSRRTAEVKPSSARAPEPVLRLCNSSHYFRFRLRTRSER